MGWAAGDTLTTLHAAAYLPKELSEISRGHAISVHDRNDGRIEQDLMECRFTREPAHRFPLYACGLVWLMRFRDSLYEQSERYRQLALDIDPAARDIAAEHRAIVEAALAGDADTAAAELARHFERTATAIAEAYHRREDQAASAKVPAVSG